MRADVRMCVRVHDHTRVCDERVWMCIRILNCVASNAIKITWWVSRVWRSRSMSWNTQGALIHKTSRIYASATQFQLNLYSQFGRHIHVCTMVILCKYDRLLNLFKFKKTISMKRNLNLWQTKNRCDSQPLGYYEHKTSEFLFYIAFIG